MLKTHFHEHFSTILWKLFVIQKVRQFIQYSTLCVMRMLSLEVEEEDIIDDTYYQVNESIQTNVLLKFCTHLLIDNFQLQLTAGVL